MMTLEEERNRWEESARKKALPEGVSLAEETIAGVKCLWVRCLSSVEGRIVLYVHGGGLVSGSIVTHRSFVAAMCRMTGLPFLIVEYRLLPENAFPAPLDDVLSVYRALISEKEIPPENLVIGGDSSGGGLVLSALTQLRDSGEPLPVSAFALSGVFDMTLSGDSLTTNEGRDLRLTREELVDWQRSYFTNFGSSLLSPLFADLSGLPPLLLLVGGRELWLSDSVRLAKKISDCGGPTSLRVWESMSHVWAMDLGLNESEEVLAEVRDFLARV